MNMNKNFAEWYRVVSIATQHEQLQARWQGIEGFCKGEPGCSEVMDLARLFFSLPITDDFKERFIESFYKADNTFPRSQNDAELAVLAGATLNYVAENDINKLRTFTLLALKSGSFGQKAIVPAILTTANDLFYTDAISIRNIDPPTEISISGPSTKSLRESLKTIEESNNWQPPNEIAKQLSAFLAGLSKTFNRINSSMDKSISAQKVYREDSQVLWWLTGEYSKDRGMPFTELKVAEAPIVIGKELADLVEILPGPYSAKAVINKLLNIYPEGNKEVVLSTAINQTDKEWRNKTCKQYDSEKTRETTPLLSAISESLRVEKAEEWLPAFKKLTKITAKSTKLSSVELSYQVYLECLLLKAYPD